MKSLKLIAIAITAAAIAGPAFAGRDEAQVMQQEKAVKKLRAAQAEQAKAAEKSGLAGSTGPQGEVGPATKRAPAPVNIGHPSERVRR